MPTAATATLSWDPRSKAGTNRFLSGESHACFPGLHCIRRGPVAPGAGAHHAGRAGRKPELRAGGV
jgi:hypothetical protein